MGEQKLAHALRVGGVVIDNQNERSLADVGQAMQSFVG